MRDLKDDVANVPDFPQPGIMFRDIAPLLRNRFGDAIRAMGALFTEAEWRQFDVVAGVESRGFILAAGLATLHGKGFVPVRKKGKLPPPVLHVSYELEYGSAVLEMQPGYGRALLIDDVLATGGTMTAAAEICSLAGYEVSALAVLIDLNLVSGFRWRGIEPRTVIQYP
ncbi:MAG: adenine phosphoribosyltransferase [Steroidobacteraceae bacterium]